MFVIVHRLKFSAAIRRGLIEAIDCSCGSPLDTGFSAAIRRGLIEAMARMPACAIRRIVFSAAIRRGLIEAIDAGLRGSPQRRRFPRRFAAASLKHR